MSFGSHHHHHHHHHHPQQSHVEFHEARISSGGDYYAYVSSLEKATSERPLLTNTHQVYKHKEACEVEDSFRPATYRVSETTYEENVDMESGDYIKRKHLMMINSAWKYSV